jgi:hypothetical protein
LRSARICVKYALPGPRKEAAALRKRKRSEWFPSLDRRNGSFCLLFPQPPPQLREATRMSG